MSMHHKKLTIPLLIVIFTISIGVIGFGHFEDLDPFNSLYLTLITASTVGYGDIVPITIEGRILSIIVTFLGVTVLLTTLPVLLGPTLEKIIHGVIHMKRSIRSLRNHTLIIGDKPLARRLAKQMMNTKQKVLFVTNNEDLIKEIEEEDYVEYLKGDYTDQDVLEKAKLSRAKAVLVMSNEDADCVLATMTARLANKQVRIIAEANEESTIPKLKRAGANAVFSPEQVLSQVIMSELSKQK